MIQLEDQTLAQMRNTMLTVLGTVMCMRVNETCAFIGTAREGS